MSNPTQYLPTTNADGASVTINNYYPVLGLVPHTYLTITTPSGDVYNYGFAPLVENSLNGIGAVTDNSDHTASTSSSSIPLTAAQYVQLAGLINSSIATPPYYSIASGQECTAWAVSMLTQAGVINPSYVTPDMNQANNAINIVQLLVDNPFVAGSTQDLTRAANYISDTLSTIAQYGEGLWNDLFNNNSGQQTITNSDGSTIVLNNDASNGTSSATFYDASGNQAANAQYLFNPDGTTSCTVNNVAGSLWTQSTYNYDPSADFTYSTQSDSDGTTTTNLSSDMFSQNSSETFDATTGAITSTDGNGDSGSLTINGSDGATSTIQNGNWSSLTSTTGSNTNVGLQDDGNSTGELSYNQSSNDLSIDSNNGSGSIVLDGGTWSNANYSDGTVSSTIGDPLNPTGYLLYNPSTGAGMVIGTNGTVTDLPTGNDFEITSNASGGYDIYENGDLDTNNQLNNPLPPSENNSGNPGHPDPGEPGGPGPGGGGGNGEEQSGNGNNQISPLVLDLTGTGLNLTALSPTSPYFDLEGDGFARKTGWIGSGTGLLVLPNADGSVTSISNLFGTNGGLESGFQALGLDDSNSDGVINASDSIFSQLRVWVDSNGNGVADSGELYSLSDLGITSISLSTTAADQTINGNTIKYTATYTLSDGSTREIADVWFNTSPTFTQPDTTPTLNSTILALPELHGYGLMTDLRSAMALDSTLETMVQNFVALPTSTDAATVTADVENVMYEWGSATNSLNDGYLVGVTGPQALFVENYTGTTLNYAYGAGPHQGASIAQAFTDVLDEIEADLVLQTPLGTLVPEFTYDAGLGMALPVGTLADAFGAAYSRLGAVTSANLTAWTLEDRVADGFREDGHISQDAFAQEIAAGSTDTVASIANAVANDIGISFAANGSIVETGEVLGSDFYAGAGISKVILVGDGAVPAGQPNYVNGVSNYSPTNDIVHYNSGDGALEISGQSDYSAGASNSLTFGAGITAADLTLTQGSGTDVLITDGTTGDQITLDNFLTTNYDEGLDAITFADGTSLSEYQLASDILATGSATKTSLSDSLGNAIFDSKGYAHSEDAGLSGNNTFLYDEGYGALSISELDYSESPNDVLKFGTGIASSSVGFSTDVAGDLVLTDGVTGDAVTLVNMMNRAAAGVQEVEFADGTTLDYEQLITAATTGSATNTSLYDGIGGAIFDTKGFAHSVNTGISANNTFVYSSGYGAVEISTDDYSTTPDNTLEFATGVTASQITVSADASDDILLGDGVAGDQVKLDEMMAGGRFGVQNVTFADGTSLSVEQLVTAANTGSATNTALYDSEGGATFISNGYAHSAYSGSSGNNTFVYNAGDGNFEITAEDSSPTSGNILQLGAGITQSDLSYAKDSSGNVYVADGTTGDQIKIDYMELISGWGIQGIQFADGTTVTAGAILNDIADQGNTVIDGGGTTHYEGGSSSTNNTFLYNSGYGSLEISDYTFASDPNNVLQFGSGITASQITVSSDTSGDLILKDGVSGDQVQIDDMLSQSYYGIQNVQFTNGTSLSKQQLVAMATTGSATNTSLYDALGDATFDPAGYAHSINSGSSSSNSFVYNAGYGALSITTYSFASSPNNVLQFGTGILPSQVTVSTDNSGDLMLKDGTSGDQIEINDMLIASYYGIQGVQFANGTSWTEQALITMATTGSASNTSLYDGLGDATFDPAGYAHSINSVSSTNNVFLYNSGYGALAINAYSFASSPDNVLRFGSGIVPSQVTVSSDTSGDLVLKDGASGDQIQINDMLLESYYGIQEVQFANGTSLTAQQLITAAVTGSATNTSLYDALGNTTFNTNGYAHYASGGSSGGNTFNFNAGNGALEIYDISFGSANTLQFGSGITSSDVSFSKGSGNIIATVGTNGDQVTLDDMTYGSYFGVQNVNFGDGTSLSGSAISGFVLGTSGNDSLTGTSGADTFYGSAGADTMSGGGGYDTYKIGANINNTTINNAVSGGTAANGEVDFLSGLTDENLWFKQVGSDLEVDELGTSNKLTISGWFGTNASAQVESFNTSDGNKLDTAVSSLVSAMASYATSNSAFNPATATAMPTDATLQSAITTAWHH